MKLALGALAVLAGLAVTPAAADGPDPAFRTPGPAYAAPYRHRRHGWHRRHRGYGYDVRSYGAPPAYGVLTGPSEYTEQYIGRGLIYNTPPAPFSPDSGAISVRG